MKLEEGKSKVFSSTCRERLNDEIIGKPPKEFIFIYLKDGCEVKY